MKTVTTLAAAVLLTACSAPEPNRANAATADLPMAESVAQFGATFYPELQRIHDSETGVTCYVVRQTSSGTGLSCVVTEVRP